MSYLTDKLTMLPIVLIALIFHECAHGYVSSKLGDPTPRNSGRLTLNPMAHLDLVGTLLMLLTGFGWAKPVPVNPSYYKNPKRGMAITAAAGPLMNLLLAFAAMIIYTLLFILNYKTGLLGSAITPISAFVYRFASVNLCFMVFNLIPIPPLDGSRIATLIIPTKYYFKIMKYERYIILAVFALIIFGVLNVPLRFLTNLVMNGLGFIANLPFKMFI